MWHPNGPIDLPPDLKRIDEGAGILPCRADGHRQGRNSLHT